uniref:Ig-like domain-containing protein n=1 Tax=Seriola lalandi dorsalis TaxID=1841481 RepID=A0A3B4W9K0_SERLL
MMLLLVWIMIVSFHSGKFSKHKATSENEVMGSEGDTVTLSCNYSGSVNSLYWYQQKSSSSPQFLIADYSEKTPGLSLQHDKKTREFHLNISSAAVTDSAVYYCAL